ncbi:MAG: 2-hydroxyglutaryl-CoA dehydratase [Bacilli bacterium]|nr:2-hydroxyglutaryl-CoA dehydratase [Bacilli bacterium]
MNKVRTLKLVKIGIDIGSTTVKIIMTDEKGNVIFSDYQRHFSDTLKTVKKLLQDGLKKYPNQIYQLALTGSGAISLANHLQVSFVQEVIACKKAVENNPRNIDVAVELGGEDAKIIYFQGGIEQRMNGSCAGGTGAFLDQMAVLLNTDTEGLNKLAKEGTNIYPIASRCGVFAKTDIQPLINEGVKKSDIALSILQAVVNQTISGLACGKPIKGNVMFLGGPLTYLDMLKKRFVKTLNLKEEEAITPENAHLFVAFGSTIENKNGEIYTYQEMLEKYKRLDTFQEEQEKSLAPLFKTKKEQLNFQKRHQQSTVKKRVLSTYEGNAFLGIDAGSTTAKLVLIDESGNILYEDYRPNLGTPVDTLKKMLLDLYRQLPKKVIIRKSGSTGYGERLIQTAFNLDLSEIETMAHYKAAAYFEPNVTSIIDIGGQDMKYIKLKDHEIDTILLNEACSSGCGSFIETLAKSLNIPLPEFVSLAIHSKNPVDLGSRCTVFMNSKIKQTQKEGRPLGDIFAGLSYSVVKNALQKVMKIRNPESLGKYIVVQGGTFLNDAVLRAFELITEREVVRPNIAGLMGAYGMALIGLEEFQKSDKKELISTLSTQEEIESLVMKTNHARCQICENHCSLTINLLGKKRFISGNRCERGSGNNGSMNHLPNMVAYKYERLFQYQSISKEKAFRGVIGIPRVLNIYEDYPFWHTFFTQLGFQVILSDHSSHHIYEKGMESIPSESVCYPAKLVHGHIQNLIDKGVKTIFYPCIMYQKKEFKNSDNSYNCPIVTSYSEAIKLNMDVLKEQNIKYMNPFLPMEPTKLLRRLFELEELKEYHFTKKELQSAIKEAWQEQENYRNDIEKKGKEFLEYLEVHDEKAIVVAGRPYHIDKEINHGIDTLINSLGLAVLTEDSICFQADENLKLRVVDQWSYHSRVYHAADVVSKNPRLELVSLNSFGCGLDAIITDQTEEILKKNHRLYTTIKIDETSNLGAIKIRLRSLIASMQKRSTKLAYQPYQYEKNAFKKEMKEQNTILCPDMSPFHMPLLIRALNSEGYHVVYLNEMNDKMLENGLKYVNNDSCYPSLIVIGQIISALQSGKYDLKKTTVLISQTGGGCRATNYIGLIRKALKDAGFENIPILSFNVSGLEKEQEFKLTYKIAKKALIGIVLGDLLMKLLYATRPYEKEKGKSESIYQKHLSKSLEIVTMGSQKAMREEIKEIVNDFQNIPIIKKQIPKIGIVGEILIKYHPYGNHNLIESLEKEGCEVAVPELMGFVKYCAYNNIIKEKLLDTSKTMAYFSQKLLDIIDFYEKNVRKALANTRYRSTTNIYNLAKNVEPILSKGNQTGEGWFLTAEMVELLKEGVSNIVCVQPFACLPNHIVGKSVIKKMKELYPKANIVAIDYDPGASVANQVNRIKLMLSVAKDNLNVTEETKIS